MSPKRERLSKLHLTERAVSDLLSIEDYSVERWGKRTAAKYLKAIDSALSLIRADPGILRHFEELPDELRYYRVNTHLLVCDVRPASIVVLTAIHGSMDLPNRLAKLLLQLSAEVTLLHARLASGGTD